MCHLRLSDVCASVATHRHWTHPFSKCVHFFSMKSSRGDRMEACCAFLGHLSMRPTEAVDSGSRLDWGGGCPSLSNCTCLQVSFFSSHSLNWKRGRKGSVEIWKEESAQLEQRRMGRGEAGTLLSKAGAAFSMPFQASGSPKPAQHPQVDTVRG